MNRYYINESYTFLFISNLTEINSYLNDTCEDVTLNSGLCC